MDVLGTAIDISFVLVMLGVAFAFVRLVIGPSLADRIVALDMMTVLIVSFCGPYALRSEDTAFVDVAIVLALVGFLATVALARYVERRRSGAVQDETSKQTPAAEGQSDG
jgi:multicomponent Na+:H+ antiporter subunit F